jgi:hypothetical protein
MVFKLFSNAKYYELAPEVVSVKEKNFDTADVWLDIENKKVILDTNNGELDVVFNDYDELLYTITRVSRAILFNDMVSSLNQARDDLLYYRSYAVLETSEDLITPLIEEIEKTKERILKGNFKTVIRLGLLAPEHAHKFIDSNPEAKKAVEDAVKKYRELCWETYEDDDPDYCDKVRPTVDVVVYAIPEEKNIVIKVKVDEIGEVYRITNKYENTDDFFKALKSYEVTIIYFR